MTQVKLTKDMKKLSFYEQDTTHRTVTDSEKSTWNGKTTLTDVKNIFKGTPTQLYYGDLSAGSTANFSESALNYSFITVLYQPQNKSSNQTIITFPTGIFNVKSTLPYVLFIGSNAYARGEFTKDNFKLKEYSGLSSTLGLEIYAW